MGAGQFVEFINKNNKLLVSCEYYTAKSHHLRKESSLDFFGRILFLRQALKINKKHLPTTTMLKVTRQKISTKIPIILISLPQ